MEHLGNLRRSSVKDKKLLRTADTLEEAWKTLDKMYGKKHDIVFLVKEIMDLKLNNKDRQSSIVMLINTIRNGLATSRL